MTGTFIDLSKYSHPPDCPCPVCQTSLHCDSLKSHLPVPSKVSGWLVPARPCSPPIRTSEIALNGEEKFTVGREIICNFMLEDFMFPRPREDENLQCNKTSRVQFEILIENERPHIVDRSMNGTFVNGIRLSKDISKRLYHGDVISILQLDLEMFCYLDEAQMMNRNYPLRIITKYLVGNVVGSGSYSDVRKGFTRSDFTPVAMKFIKKNQLPSWLCFLGGKEDSVRSEVDILQQLHHPCITSVLDTVDTTFELVIVMEYAEGGELEKQVKMDTIMGRLSEVTAKLQFYQICHTIAYLHSQNICHRDLKLANILLMEPNPEALLKVSDFGVSKVWSSSNQLASMVGTPLYMAPEVLVLSVAPHLSYTCKSDCWSLGVVLYILLSGDQPFVSQFMGQSVSSQIMTGMYQPMSGDRWGSVSRQAKDLVDRLLVVEPSNRLGAAQILQHPWFTEDINTCRRARNVMFGTQNSVGSSTGGTTTDSGLGSREESYSALEARKEMCSEELSRKLSRDASKEKLAGQWRTSSLPKSDGEEEDMEGLVDDIRSRLRPRLPKCLLEPSIPGTPPRGVKKPVKMGRSRVGSNGTPVRGTGRGTPVRGTLTLLKGNKRKEGGDLKMVAFILPGKRQRRNSEMRLAQPVEISAEVVSPVGRKTRRRRMTTGV